jgi:methyl-accepting chemotaxis protein
MGAAPIAAAALREDTSVAARERNRRLGWTRFLVPDPAFLWYLRWVVINSLLAATFFGGLLWWYHGRLLDLLGLYDLLDGPGVRDLLVRYAELSLLVTAISVFGAAGFVIVISMFFLHRIGGPIYRLKVHMVDITAGEKPRELRFRKDDQLADLADIFNDMMRRLGHLEPAKAAPARTDAAAPAKAAVQVPVR